MLLTRIFCHFEEYIFTAQLQEERDLNACQNNGTVHTSTLKRQSQQSRLHFSSAEMFKRPL